MRNLLPNLLIALTLPLATACGPKGIQLGELSSTTEDAFCIDDCAGGPISATRVNSLAVLSSSQILRSWETCLQVQASNATRSVFNAAASTFSVEGDATTATAPTMLQAMTLAGSICLDLVQKERNADLPVAERLIFKNAALLNEDGNQFNRAAVEDVVKNISRACYGRQPAQEDTNEALRAISDFNSSMGTSAGDNRLRAMMLCSGLLASAAGVSF